MPDTDRSIVRASRNLTPLVIATVTVADSPSAISAGRTDTENSGMSLSSSTTDADPRAADTV